MCRIWKGRVIDNYTRIGWTMQTILSHFSSTQIHNPRHSNGETDGHPDINSCNTTYQSIAVSPHRIQVHDSPAWQSYDGSDVLQSWLRKCSISAAQSLMIGTCVGVTCISDSIRPKTRNSRAGSCSSAWGSVHPQRQTWHVQCCVTTGPWWSGVGECCRILYTRKIGFERCNAEVVSPLSWDELPGL